jgi:O-antigen ligase
MTRRQVAVALAPLAAIRPAWPLSAGLALSVFSGHWDTMGVPIALDRLLLLVGILATLVHARVRSRDALQSRPVDWLLAVVAIYVVVSAVLAGTLDDRDARIALFDRLSLVGFVLFFVAPLAYAAPEDRRILLGFLVALGGYLGLTALLETTGPRALVLPHYITDPRIGTHIDRARGPQAEAAANGMLLLTCGVAAAIATMTWRDPRRRKLAVAVLALCGLGILLTVTRAAWLGAAAGSIVALLALPAARRLIIPGIVLTALGVALAFAAVPGLQGRAQHRVDDRKPIWDRENSNAAALRMVAAHPVLGFGWGRFATDSRDFYRQSPDRPLTFVHGLHNLYLTYAVEIGLLGTLLWLITVAVVILGAVGRRGPPSLRAWKVGLLAVATCYGILAASTPLGFASPTLLLWAWAGVAWGPRAAPSAAGELARNRSERPLGGAIPT